MTYDAEARYTLTPDVENQSVQENAEASSSLLLSVSTTSNNGDDDYRKDHKPGLDVKGAVTTMAVCVGFLLVGPMLILQNKRIMHELDFDFPVLIAMLGQVFSSVGSFLVCRVFRWYPLEHSDTVTRDFYIKNMLAVGAASATTLVAGNALYLYLTVSFIQMLKAFTPVVTLALLVAFQVETPSKRIVFCVTMIAAGTCIAAAGEMNLSLVGFVLFLLASIAEGAKLVLSQKLLSNLKFHAFEALFYFAPTTSVIMFAISWVHEIPRLYSSGKFSIVVAHPREFIEAGILGFFVNIAMFFVIGRTNAVMIKVMATSRNAGLVLFSVFAQGEIVTMQEGCGYAWSLLFFGLYNYFKMTSHTGPLVVHQRAAGAKGKGGLEGGGEEGEGSSLLGGRREA